MSEFRRKPVPILGKAVCVQSSPLCEFRHKPVLAGRRGNVSRIGLGNVSGSKKVKPIRCDKKSIGTVTQTNKGQVQSEASKSKHPSRCSGALHDHHYNHGPEDNDTNQTKTGKFFPRTICSQTSEVRALMVQHLTWNRQCQQSKDWNQQCQQIQRRLVVTCAANHGDRNYWERSPVCII